jgi:hypothetical protein
MINILLELWKHYTLQRKTERLFSSYDSFNLKFHPQFRTKFYD